MSRIILRALLVPLLISVAFSARAGQTPPDAPRNGSTKAPQSAAPPVTTSGVMQLKKQISGDLSYRFVSPGEKAAAPASAPVPLPAPASGGDVVALAIPSTVSLKDGVLEILDNSRGNIARLPISTTGVANLSESSFTLAQRVNIPVQSKGLDVVGAQVTLTSASKKYSQTRLLQPDDNGVARFDGVPLGEPVTVTVSYGSNPPESQTKTLTVTRPADPWPAVAVTWPDAKTVTPAAPPPSTGTNAPPRDSESGRRGSDEDTRSTRQPESNPLNSLVSTVISLLFLVAVGYGVFWAYKTGRLKNVLDRLGINTDQMAATSAAMPDPFSKQRTPIQPITEGTADPFAGAALAGGAVSAAPIADGPRLIATAGAYAGSIFPLNGPSADIGRDTGNAIPLPNDTNASRRHATVQASNGQYQLVDNGSSNGTFVNGVRIVSQTPQALRPGDEVQIGMTRFRFEA